MTAVGRGEYPLVIPCTGKNFCDRLDSDCLISSVPFTSLFRPFNPDIEETAMFNSDQKSEFDSLLPGQSTENGATRRTALKAALGVGYAATALPIMAQTAIKTSAEGLKAGEKVIVQGQQRVRPGMTVTPTQAPPAASAKKQ